MKRLFVCLSVLVLALTSVATAQNRTYSVEDLMKVRRVGDPQISPDGRQVAFTIGDVNLDANRVVTHIYLTSIDGGETKQLTNGDRSCSSPRWSPDGKKIAYTTGSQVWTMDTDGENKEQVTKLSTGAAAP
ncbi:MAG TPA: DPP IV N-terminal domain-containing protein, partial [Pyrinomonadaceae bacterium]|nr:DPP IV N-terminal domain-containing protein [Pyrinomonadaceae bacterium]